MTMTPEMINEKAVKNAKDYLKAAFGGRYVLTDAEWDTCARAAIGAALNGWEKKAVERSLIDGEPIALTIPLTQEKQNG